MADAESNLVPSEAVDQVEVALEKQAAADDGILYLNEYQYENDLVTDFARLVASPRRRGSLYVAAAIAALIGIGMLVAGGNWIKFGVVLIVFGAFLAWWSKNLHHTLARDFIDAVEADESMGGRYRRVAANEDGLMVWGKSGKSQFFPFDKLDHVLDGERIFVAMFADQGVTIPKDTFVRGDAEQFGPFLKARINKKLRIETKRKKMKAEKAAAEAKQGDKPQETKRKQRKQKNKKKRQASRHRRRLAPRHSGPGRLGSSASATDGPILPSSRVTSLQTLRAFSLADRSSSSYKSQEKPSQNGRSRNLRNSRWCFAS